MRIIAAFLALVFISLASTVSAQRQTSPVATALRPRMIEWQKLYDAKKYTEGAEEARTLAKIAEESDRKTPNLDVRELAMTMRYNAACCAALAGDADASEKEMFHAVDNDYLDRDVWMADPDLAPLTTSKERVAAINAHQDAREAALDAKTPGYILLKPKGTSPDASMGVIVALHGAGGTARGWSSYWQGVSDATGRAVILGRGSLAEGDSAFYWSRFWWKMEARRAHGWIEDARKTVPGLDPSQAIISGFSQGGGVAAIIGTLDPSPWQGAVVFAPYVQVAHRAEIAKRGAPKGRPIVVWHGDQEAGDIFESASILANLPPPGAIVHVGKGFGHVTPPLEDAVAAFRELETLATKTPAAAVRSK